MLSAIILAQVIAIAAPVAPSLYQQADQDPYAVYKKNLVPIGTKVPNFNVKDDSGRDFDLYSTFNDKAKVTANFWQGFDVSVERKGTIINFWFAH